MGVACGGLKPSNVTEIGDILHSRCTVHVADNAYCNKKVVDIEVVCPVSDFVEEARSAKNVPVHNTPRRSR
jgi:hypothetical protein